MGLDAERAAGAREVSGEAERARIERARERLRSAICTPPLLPAPGDIERTWIWPESLQPTGSFKVRGVLHAVLERAEEGRRRGFLTVSAGNTAKALAWAARLIGARARSLVPVGAPRSKVDAIRRLGAEPIERPMDELLAFLREERFRDEPDVFVHPWTDEALQLGHGTLVLDLLEAVPDLAEVIVPVGGGGLLLGVAPALQATGCAARLVAVEPEGCAALHASLAAGRPVDVECATMCDGVAVPFVLPEVFERAREVVDGSVTVAEDEVRRAMRSLALESHLVAEGAGALALAAARRLPPPARGARVALVTGGGVDADTLADAIEGANNRS